MAYPNVSTSFSTLVDGQDRYKASYVNAVQTAVDSIITAMAHKQEIVVVAKARGDYTTLSSAATAIDDASSSKPYTILLAPGIYETSEVTIPDYVSVIGYDRNSCILQDTTAASDYVLKLGTNTTLSNLTITEECDAQSSATGCIDTNGKTGISIQDCQITFAPSNAGTNSYCFLVSGASSATVYNTDFTHTVTDSVMSGAISMGNASAALVLRDCSVTLSSSYTLAAALLITAGALECYDSEIYSNRLYCVSYAGDSAIFQNCRIEGTANNAYCAYVTATGAIFYGCTMVKHSAASDCISTSANLKAAHCRFNDTDAVSNNLIGTPYNVLDVDVT